MRRCFWCISGAWALMLGAGASAQVASMPLAGTVLEPNGRLAAIHGVLQNLLPGVPVAAEHTIGEETIRSAAFGTNGGAVKTDSHILIIGSDGTVQSRRDAAPGPALFGFASDGVVEWLYLFETSGIQNLQGGPRIDARPLGDELIALGATDARGVPVLARTGTQLWAEIVNPRDGSIQRQIPVDGTAPGVFFEGGWLVKNGQGLLWASPEDGATRAIESSVKISTLQPAGPHSVAVNGRLLLNATWSLLEIPRAFSGRPALPAPSPRGSRR